MAAHARLSASAAHRWLRCPGSIELSEGLPDDTSEAAAEGTFAHHIASSSLEGGKRPHEWLGNKTIIEGHTIECTQEMVDAVNVYVDSVTNDYQSGDKFWIEQNVTPALQNLHPWLGGTADYIRYRPATRELRVRDFKYGAGVFVDAVDNVQAMTYALGALLSTGVQCDTVKVTIDQPRIDHEDGTSRDFVFPAVDILEFAADLVEGAERVKPGAEIVSGSHCKFCPAKLRCPVLEAKQNALVAAEFNAVQGYDVEKLAEALGMVEAVRSKIKALEEFAYAEAERGVIIPGYKLVDKRPTRKWDVDEAIVAAWARERGIEPFEEPKLKSPAQLEKGLKKAEKGAIAAFVVKQSSGHALVPLSDERPPAKLITADAFDVVSGSGGTASTEQQSPAITLF
jgi:hypothetical protein